MTPEIVFEDNHIIIVNKPPGMLSQGDSTGEDSLLEILKKYVKKKYNKEGDAFIGLVHRLDRPVSGLMVFARTSKAARRLHSEIISGNMDKYYAAVVETELPADGRWHRLENFLIREKDITKISSNETKESQKAILFYRTVLTSNRYTLVLIKLDTGRKHQIRAQFSEIGAPVAGDKKYGSLNELRNSICLHSVYLSFPHPTLKTEMKFCLDIPGSFLKFIQANPEKVKKEILDLTADFKDSGFCV